MRSEVRHFLFPLPAAFTAAFLLAGSSAEAQLSGTTDVNLSHMKTTNRNARSAGTRQIHCSCSPPATRPVAASSPQ